MEKGSLKALFEDRTSRELVKEHGWRKSRRTEGIC
jgi:hypothetical protein